MTIIQHLSPKRNKRISRKMRNRVSPYVHSFEMERPGFLDCLTINHANTAHAQGRSLRRTPAEQGGQLRQAA